ncbi:MAG: hypothetical protein KBA64_02675 [Armatimonadetes bacterium]|nr:hypothetical protein [Armatimonadota bacterium]NLN88914.1 hypothetical protein [candidate division WS1 bacterium]
MRRQLPWMAIAALFMATSTVLAQQERPRETDPGPWQGQVSDPIDLAIDFDVLYLPEGPSGGRLVLQGEQLSYSHGTRTLVLLEASDASVSSVREIPGAESIGTRTVATRGGQSVEAQLTRPLGWAVPSDEVPDEFTMGGSEWGVTVKAHPVYSADRARVRLYMSLQARTPRSAATADMPEVDQVHFPWFSLPLRLGSSSILLLPHAAEGSPGSGPEPPTSRPVSALGGIRYAVVIRVSEEGAPATSEAGGVYPAFRLGPGIPSSARPSDIRELLSAVRERTGIGLSFLGGDPSAEAVRQGLVKVLFQFPGARAEDQLTMRALRIADLTSVILGTTAFAPPPTLGWDDLATLSAEGQRQLVRDALDSLEAEITETQRAIQDLRAELEAAEAAASPPPPGTP